MKILQVCSYLYPALAYGGPAKVVYDLSLELSKKNEVTIYTSDVWDSKLRINKKQMLPSKKNLQIKYFSNFNNYFAFKFRLFTAFGMVSQFLKERKKYDLVHLHDVFIMPQLLIAFLARIFFVPYVVTPHGVLDPIRLQKKSFIKNLFWILAKPILQNARFIIAVSAKEKNDLQKLGLNRIITIDNGILQLNTKPSKKFQKFKKRGLLTLLYVGKIHPQKGLKELMTALGKSDLKYQFLIAGPDDWEKPSLKKLIKKLKIKNIYFLGLVNDAQKKELYSLSDLFVYPSYAEGFSISILEAMLAGLPVLITKGCNFSDVTKYRSGFIVQNKNLEQNLFKILNSQKMNKINLKRMGQNAQHLIKKKYTAQLMVKKTAIIYQRAHVLPGVYRYLNLEALHKIIFKHPLVFAKYMAFTKFYFLKNQKPFKTYYYFNPKLLILFVYFVLVEFFYCQVYKLKIKLI